MGVGSLNILCVLVFAVLWSHAYTDDKCSGCKGQSGGAAFLSNHKYNYAVDGEVLVFLSGGDKQETGIKINGQVTVSALGNCAHILKVQNLQITGPDGKKYGKPTGLEKPVQFTLEDGRVGSEICSETGDTRRSINIKRAIISLLQGVHKQNVETDVFGSCPTEVSSSQEGGAVLVHKSRDLSRCAHREHGRNDIVAGIYNPHSDIKNTQLLQSSLNVESKIINGVPEKVSAIEEYLYKPFSVGENGARAKVHTKLSLTGQSGGVDSGSFSDVRTIIFEVPHGLKSDHGNLQNAHHALKETAKTLQPEASSTSAGVFAQLIRIFRVTSKDDFVKLYSQSKGNSLERRVFLDALLRTGTGCSVEALVDLIKKKELSAIEEKLVYLSFGTSKHVTEEAVKAVSSLLDNPHAPQELYVSSGALAGVYCTAHSCHNPTHVAAISALTGKLAAKLQNCKPASKSEEDFVIAAFRGIRSIRHIEDSVVDRLVHCANDNGVKSRVKVAALEAFLADPCTAKLKKTALDILKNRQLDSEIRIKAYLAVIGCPCSKSATEIKNLLDTEPIHQVGRYISSSLRHIRASASPDKQLARQHYGQIHTPNKFNVDDRKYSFYREGSFHVDAIGLGGSVEQSVIFSQDSFLPRSANLNLTVEMFGHYLNVLEVGGRQGNLDRVVEHFLGPKSIFKTHGPQELYDGLIKKYHEAEHKVEQKVRGRRAIKQDIDNFDKHLKAEAQPYNNELDLDVYVKLFGTESVFLSFGDDKGINFEAILDKLLGYVEGGISKAKHFQHELRTHMLLIDAELAYPTSTGLPLKLQLLASGTAKLDIATSIDIRQIIRDPNNARVDVKLIPSVDIEVAGTLVVDADVVTAGLKQITNLHSSTGGHLIAKALDNGHGFDIQLALPIDKQELITATGNLVLITAEKGQLEKQTVVTVEGGKSYSECFDQLAGVLGLTLCGEVDVPFSVSGTHAQASIQKFIARYPLTGPVKLKLYLEKNDLRSYHVKYLYKGDTPDRKSFELLFEVEGAKNRRASLNGEYVNTEQEKKLYVALDSPIKKAIGEVSVINKNNEYSAKVAAQLDNDKYEVKGAFKISGDDRRKVYDPYLHYLMPGTDGIKVLKVDGKIIREVNGPSTKYTLKDIKVNVPNSNEPIEIVGHFTRDQLGYEGDIKAKNNKHTFLISSSYKDKDFTAELQNTLNPFVNFKVKVHSENDYALKHYQNDIDLFYGDLQSPNNHVQVNQLLKYHHESKDDFSVLTKNELIIAGLPLKVKIFADVDPKKVDVELDGQYLEKKGELKLEARTQIHKPGDYSAKLVTSVNNKGFEAFAKRDIVGPHKSNLENYVIIKGVGKYEISGVVLHKRAPHDVSLGAVGHIKISAGNKVDDIKFDIGVVETTALYSSHAKVNKGNDAYIDYLLKITRGANPTGQLKLSLKDTINANGQFKVTDSDGKGNGMIIVDFKNAQRKFKGDVKFVSKEPSYSADVDIYLNYEKDNNDKLHFSTNTKKAEKLVDTKNQLTYSGKKTEFNLKIEGECVTKGHTVVEVVLPTERVLGLDVNRNIDQSEKGAKGNIDVTLSDAPKRGAPPSKVNYKASIDTQYDKDILNYEGQFNIDLKTGKNLVSNFYLKNNPATDKKYKLDFKTEVKGNLIPKPALLTVTMDYDYFDDLESFIDNDAKYRVKASYGDDVGLTYDRNEFIKIMDKGDKKFHSEDNLQIRLPFDKAHDIKYVSNILLLFPVKKETYIEYTVSYGVTVNGASYRAEGGGELGPHKGLARVKLLVPHQDPLTIDTAYHVEEKDGGQSGSLELKSTYGKDKSIEVKGTAASTGARDYRLTFLANAPHNEKLKKIELNLLTKNPSPSTYTIYGVLDLDSHVSKLEASTVYSKQNPQIDIKYTCPHLTNARIFLKGTDLEPGKHGSINIKIENVRELTLDATYAFLVDKDSIHIKFAADSEKLKLKGYVFEVNTKDVGGVKKLEVHSVNNNKNIVSGSTSFISKQEGQKTIVEGSGSMKVHEEQKSATFKYIRTLLTEGNEQGVENFMNVAIGDRSYVAESRFTNLEYKNSYVYCEEKKQCAHAEYNSKINVQTPGEIQHTVNIVVDLRKLGFAPEFGLSMLSEVSEKKLPQHTLDVHLTKDKANYHVHLYFQPKHGNFPAGLTITLPKRVIALESAVSYPPNKALPFPLRAQVALFLDKNKPSTKAALRMLIDVIEHDKKHTATAEFGFSHPKLGKEALLKFQGDAAHPSDNNYKIESFASFSHPTFGPERHSKFLVEVNPRHLKFSLDTPLVKVIDLDASVAFEDKLQRAELTFSLLQGKPVLARASLNDYSRFEFTTGYSEESERKISVTGNINPEERVEISADIILPGTKKNIGHAAVFVQDNLIKTDYGVSKDNFNYFVNALKGDLGKLEERVQLLGEKASAEFKENISKGQNSLKQLTDAYAHDLEELKTELINDETLKTIDQALGSFVKFVAQFVDDIMQVTAKIVHTINEAIKDMLHKLNEVYDKELKTQVEQIYKSLSELIRANTDGLLDVVAHVAALFADFIEKYKPELQELTKTLTEIFKDLTRITVARLKEFRAALIQVFNDLVQQIKDLPLVATIKEKLQELSVPEQILALLTQLHQSLKTLLPTVETREFADAVNEYVQKKLKNEKIDDNAELKALYSKGTAALSSLVQFIRGQLNQLGVPALFNVNVFPSLSGYGFSAGAIPSFSGGAKLSFLQQLIAGDVPDLMSYIRAYRPRSFNPLDEVPSKLRAVIVRGQHIFTFDGRHMTFPGNCRYVLAHDYQDRNFTLVTHLAQGAPKSIALEDKSGVIIELRENGQVALNGAVHGFPVIEKDIFAFRRPDGGVGVGSYYGLLVLCYDKLSICYVEASGFYLGKLRGLLGDGNNEPYDDFRLPNGKIIQKEADFGNAYKLSSSCAAVTTPDHSHHHGSSTPACDLVFGGTSPLRPLSLLLDIAPFKQACAHATASKTGAEAVQEACDLAKGYVALADTGLVPAIVPQACLQCENTHHYGDTYQIHAPNKQADIIVTVETTKGSEKLYKDLVVPLVSHVVAQFKAKHFDDIKVYVVGITSKFPYPLVYDIEHGAKIQFNDESRIQNWFTPIKTGCPRADAYQDFLYNAITEVSVALGASNVITAYNRVLNLPLRTGAIKQTIAVTSEVCRKPFFLIESLRSLTMRGLLNNNLHSVASVALTPNLAFADNKPVTNVIGYTSSSVLQLGDKKHGADTQQLREQLKTTPDSCTDYTQSADGIVISGSNFEGLAAPQQKQFISQSASAIVERAIKTPVTLTCTCSYNSPYSAKSFCVKTADEKQEQKVRRKK